MGQKVTLSETFSDSSLPKLYPDALMSAGSLMLLDLSHSLGGVTGVPAHTASIPNIAAATAATLTGAASSACNAEVTRTDVVGTDSFLERTPKKGLHVVFSQVTNTNSARAVVLGLPIPLADYLTTNRSHKFYFSIWQTLTRVSPSGANGTYASIGQGTTGDCFLYCRANTPVVNGQAYLSKTINTLGAQFEAIGVDAYTGTGTPSSSTLRGSSGMVGWGSWFGYQGFDQNKSRSAIWYRSYLEDLTVSAEHSRK